MVIVTGIDYPGHKWRETVPALAGKLRKDPRLQVDVVEKPEFLASEKLRDYSVVVLHFMNWETPDPGEQARQNLARFVREGGGVYTAVLLVPAVLAIVVLVAASLVLARRGWVVRLGDEGYRVQWVRGVGVAAARWKDVEDAVTTTRAGSPCVVLRLRNGGTTTIPVDVLAGDREEFVRDLQRHLTGGQGLRPL